MKIVELRFLYERMLSAGVPELCDALHEAIMSSGNNHSAWYIDMLIDHVTLYGVRYLSTKTQRVELCVFKKNNWDVGVYVSEPFDGMRYRDEHRETALEIIVDTIESMAETIQTPDSEGWWLRKVPHDDKFRTEAWYVIGSKAGATPDYDLFGNVSLSTLCGPNITWSRMYVEEE